MKGWKSFEIDAQTQRSTLISQRSTGGPGSGSGGGLSSGGMPQRTRSVDARNLPSSSGSNQQLQQQQQQQQQQQLSLMQQLPIQQQQQQQQQQAHKHRPSICNDNNVLLNAETLSDERTQALMLAVLVTMVRNTTDENESRILYEYLAEASVVFPKVFPVIHSLIDAKINYVLANCHDHVILNAVHSIIQNMICTEEPSQQQLSYLQSIGFGGLWRFSGQFTKANQNKDHAEHFVNLLEAMVETYLPPDDLELRPAFRLNIAAGGRNMSGSLSSLSLGSLQSPTEKMGQRCSGGQSDLLNLGSVVSSVSAAGGAAAVAIGGDHSTQSGSLASRMRHGSSSSHHTAAAAGRLIRQGSTSSGTQVSDLSPTLSTSTPATAPAPAQPALQSRPAMPTVSARPPPLVKISQDSFQHDEPTGHDPTGITNTTVSSNQHVQDEQIALAGSDGGSSAGESLYNRAAGGHVNPLMAKGLSESQD